MAKNEKPAAKPAEATTVRVLTAIHVDGALVPPDAVIKLPAETLDHYVAAGSVDPHPDAVKYAEKLAADKAKAAKAGDVLEA